MVTIENFLAWKATFDLEMNELRRRRQKEEEQGSKGKLTGETSLQRPGWFWEAQIPQIIIRPLLETLAQR